jgi:hypothetical protein
VPPTAAGLKTRVRRLNAAHALPQPRPWPEDDRRASPTFAKDFKQRTGFAYTRATGRRLWQEGSYDRVLRADENVEEVVRYRLGNPVRAGLVRHPFEWPHIMSERYDLREFLEGVERIVRRSAGALAQAEDPPYIFTVTVNPDASACGFSRTCSTPRRSDAS